MGVGLLSIWAVGVWRYLCTDRFNSFHAFFMSKSELGERGGILTTMELTTIERKLWDSFGEALWKHLQGQLSNIPQNEDPLTLSMMIESSINMFITVYGKQPHPGISNDRANEIFRGVAYLMKKNIFEIS